MGFKEDLKVKVKVDRTPSGEIIITESLKRLLIEYMEGEISKKELMERSGIGDKGTVEIKIKQLVAQMPELTELYNRYLERKSKPSKAEYDFIAEAIEMLRKDLSQSEMAVKIGVPVRSFSTKMKKLQEANRDNQLGKLLEEHSYRKMRRKGQSAEEYVFMCIALEDYEKEHPIGKKRYDKRNPLDIRKEYLREVISRGQKHNMGESTGDESVSESYLRKCRAELAALEQIMERD